MKLVDIIPIFIVITAIIINIAIGVQNEIGFSVLMARCIIVTIVFGIFGYMVTKTFYNAIEYSKMSKLSNEKPGKNAESEESRTDNKDESLFDIKVPPLDDKEFISMSNGNDDEFVEMNPVDMGNYNKDVQD